MKVILEIHTVTKQAHIYFKYLCQSVSKYTNDGANLSGNIILWL